MQPELIADYACHTGENPLWHPLEQRVYWCDIPRGRLFRYDPVTGRHEQVLEGEALGGFTVQADGALLLFMACGAVRLLRDGALSDVLAELPDERDSRFNDVIADPQGRVFCGTMPTPERNGRLYQLDTNGTITKLLDDISCSNGMGFTPDQQQMYYTDTGRSEIYLFDYDAATGGLSNRRTFAHTAAGEGRPDGLTVDADGSVWSARWDGGRLVRLAHDGTVAQRIDFPARKVSSVTFGGADYTDMYVTTAGGDHKATEGAGAGALFRLRVPDVRGRAEFFSRVGLPE